MIFPESNARMNAAAESIFAEFIKEKVYTMNQHLNIIPTPRVCEYKEGSKLKVKKVYIRMCSDSENSREIGEKLQCALKMLEQEEASCLTDIIEEADLILTDRADEMFTGSEAELLSFFREKYAMEQGYFLQKKENGPVVIAAQSELGCVYGIMTLLQILGQGISEITIKDWPDFNRRGNKWTIWAESGIWSYDFGDGAEAIKERMLRKLDMNMRYKINVIYADSFGLDTDRFREYTDIMRFANDRARERGISLYTGCYGMSYGQQGYGGTYQGKAYLNRKSYPDGEVYECIGSYDAYDVDFDTGEADRTKKKTEVFAREHGTCLSNEALFELKAAEMEEYLKKTHCGGFYLHNMDAHEMHPELWMARCEECRKRWPNDDLFAEDGAAGAFAYYFGKLAERLACVKDGDYNAARDFHLMVISPGYLYPVVTDDRDFDMGMKFWAAVSRYIKSSHVTIGFREEFFYHEKEVQGKAVRRAVSLQENTFACDTEVINFSGADGFYDDKIFTITSVLNYMMKGYDGILCANGNAFQEPLQIFNAEYLWNCENSGFYNLKERPQDQTAFMKLYKEMISSGFRPEEIYGDGGFLDVICGKLYGREIGGLISAVYKLAGDHGEPPVACASSVDIYTNYSKIIFPMRWDNEDITMERIVQMQERFRQCAAVSGKAADLVKEAVKVLSDSGFEGAVWRDITWLCDCFVMGSRLCGLLYEYMGIYAGLERNFEKAEGTGWSNIESDLQGAATSRTAWDYIDDIEKLREKNQEFCDYVASSGAKPLDKLGGSMVRRKEMGEFLEYNTSIMLSSIRTGKRIPDDRKPLPTKRWW